MKLNRDSIPETIGVILVVLVVIIYFFCFGVDIGKDIHEQKGVDGLRLLEVFGGLLSGFGTLAAVHVALRQAKKLAEEDREKLDVSFGGAQGEKGLQFYAEVVSTGKRAVIIRHMGFYLKNSGTVVLNRRQLGAATLQYGETVQFLESATGQTMMELVRAVRQYGNSDYQNVEFLVRTTTKSFFFAIKPDCTFIFQKAEPLVNYADDLTTMSFFNGPQN